jgi:hypothetical protein
MPQIPAPAMEVEEGGPPGPSYITVTTPELGIKHFKRLPFELPTDLRNILWEEDLRRKNLWR